MSSSDGVARLKNWQSTAKALVVPAVNWKGSMWLSEVRAKVSFVDESTVVLEKLDAPGETGTFSLIDIVFACSNGSDLELRRLDGSNLYLREEE